MDQRRSGMFRRLAETDGLPFHLATGLEGGTLQFFGQRFGFQCKWLDKTENQ